MVASLLKIVSTGVQDERLQPPKDQPDLGAFLTVIVKAGRYGTAWARIDFDTKPDFGQTAIIRIPTQGELVGRIMLVTQMPDIKTEQDKAYRARKVPKLFSNKYKDIELVEDFKYSPSSTIVYPQGSSMIANPDSITLADFSGVQLDDLLVGATYTLNFSIPQNSPTTIFSAYLTDSGFNNQTFDMINKDSIILAAPTGEFLSYSYNGLNWNAITGPANLSPGSINKIVYDGSKWAAAGVWGVNEQGSIYSTNLSQPILQPSRKGSATNVAWNGTTYLAYGSWNDFDPPNAIIGFLSSSSDGVTWSAPYFPTITGSSGNFFSGAVINSIIWAGSASKWIMACNLIDFSSNIYTLLTSPDGITWTVPTITPTPDYGYGVSMKKVAWNGLQGVNSLYMVVGSWYIMNGLTGYRCFLRSTDTVNWMVQLNPGGYINNNLDTSNAVDIVWTGYKWVAIGTWKTPMGNTLGEITTSSDGFRWSNPFFLGTFYELGSDGQANAISVNSDYIIVAGNWYNGTIVKSSGIFPTYAWINVIKPSRILIDIISLNCVISIGRDIVAGGIWGDGTGTLLGTLSLSMDGGVTWSPPTYPQYLIDLNTTIGGYTNAISQNKTTKIYLAVGYWYDTNNPTTLNTICSSTDGLNWTGAPDPTGQTGVAYCITYSIVSLPYYWWVGGSWADSGGNYLGSITRITLDVNGNVIWDQISNIKDVISGTCYGIARDVNIPDIIIAVGQWITNSGTKTISVSTDNGLSWSTPVNPTDPNGSEINDPNAIGKCVICLDPNTFIIGGTWKTDTNTYSIIYLRIIGDQKSLVYQSWTDFPSITGTQIANSIAYNGQEYVAVGQWGNNTICTSEDAVTWTLPTNPNEVNSTGNVGTGLVYNSQNKNWITVGSWASLPYNIVYANVVLFNYGVTWSTPFDPPGVIVSISESPNSGKHVVWNPTTIQWTMAGSWVISRDQSNYEIFAYVTNSSDGITWSLPYTIPQLINPIIINGLFVKNNDTLFLGSWFIANALISSSSDGINWSYPIVLPGVSGMYSIYKNGIKGNGTIWLTYGKFKDSNNNYTYNIFYSYDTVNWSPATIPSDILDIKLNNSYVNDIAWTGSYWLAAGLFYNIAGVAGIFSKSVDGINWSTPILPSNLIGLKSDFKAYTITWNGTIFVSTVSYIDNEDSILFISSTDGINWSPPVNPINTVYGSIKSVASNDIIWLATGRWLIDTGYSYISYSYDGITWVPLSLPFEFDSLDLRSIGWNGSIWIAGGEIIIDTVNSPVILTSFDGINWVENDNPPGQSSVTAIGIKRTLPYTGQQLFNPFIKNQSVTKLPPIILNPSANPPSYPTGSVVTWNSDPVYGNGTNYFTYLYNTVYFSTAGIIPIVNSPTFTFVATKRTQWLTFGTYYNLNPVQIILTLVNSAKLTVATDLVGPHFSWTNSLGHALINNVSLRIGGTLVDTIPGQLMEIIDEFQTPLERVKETSNLLCRDISAFNQSSFGTKTTGQIVTTPLPFWFSRGDPGCFLPIDALNIDEVRISVQFNPITSLYYTDSRTTDTTGKIVQTNTAGAGLWPLAGSQFYYQDDDGSTIPGLEPYTTKGQKFLPFPNIKMPTSYTMPESYLMVEYIYLDKPEANRFRIADLQVPVVQHYAFEPVDNQNNQNVRIPLIVPNPTRDLFFYCNRYEAPGYNAPFLGTRDLSNNLVPQAPWWPNSTGLDDHYYGIIRPGYSKRYSEPLRWLSLDYAETLNRYSTENVGLFRSAIPSVEQRKAPFVNRYYYNLPLGIQNGFTPFSTPIGEANLDKVLRLNLTLGFHGKTGIINDSYVDRFITYTYAETYNIFRVYGGRGGMMFAY
jgi:hypothetical protein